ncbi:MAG: bifunctional 5,10-methylenetetrahydrofolate dehydrogenase/5,10-methenyltetrahydrofolate cyclohydrolase [Parachlamydiales bacterium]|nr:bifunctional 5,10-methylenetetrahydrofolate dehydrogenase/5,10-methenyltetrahydrofolate cyclohydrolase [Parachlamydiales bacterium]
MIIDGKAISEELLEELKLKIQNAKQFSKAKQPGLVFVLVGEHPPSHSYVSMKAKACEKVGIKSTIVRYPERVDQNKLQEEIQKLNQDPLIHGILVQLPLPDHIDSYQIMETIDPKKDVDGFNPINMGKLILGQTDGFFPCTPEGILILLQKAKVNTQGKNIVILGRSNIVGKPLAALLMQKATYGNATVTLLHSQSVNIKKHCKEADILIAAIGQPGFIKRDMVKQDAVIIDVGINFVDDLSVAKKYRIVGDVDFDAVQDLCSAITPVPKGVGPMTIALLLIHTWKSFCKLNSIPKQYH